ncbi:coniferyl-aldehyde dehydrogenase, partial [Vibrio campbellii]|nr:coniferyl-aldehyde dehydrogenase [Vibrio campbellii]
MNVLAKQDTDVQRDQGMIATNDSTVNELEMWFAELQAAYQAEPAASYAVRKHRLLALKKQLSRYQDVL